MRGVAAEEDRMSTGSDSRAVFPSRIRDPFAPEPWAARARYIAPDMKHDPAQLASFAVAHMEGDTLGDALAAWLSDPVNDGGRAQFERALAAG